MKNRMQTIARLVARTPSGPALAPAAGALALVLLLGATGILATFDRAWLDSLQRGFASRAPVPAKTAIVLVDEQSLRALGTDPHAMRWPWPRRVFAGLFAALDRAGAERILADFIFLEHSENAVDDALLASVSAGLRTVTLGAMRGDGQAPPALPLVWPPEYRRAHAGLFSGKPRWGWVDIAPDPDGILRRYAPGGSLAASGMETPAAVAGPRLLRWRGGIEEIKARGVPVLSAAPYAVEGLRILGAASAQTDEFENPGTLVRAIAGQSMPETLSAGVRGRTVLIGVNAAGAFDSVATPAGAPEPGVIAHWTALADLRGGTFVRDSGLVASVAAMLLAVAGISIAARKGTDPRRLAILSGILLAVALGGGAALFALGGVWFAPAPAVAGTVFVFGAESAAGVLRERAQKREIQGWFGAYVSPAVVRNILRNPAAFALGGERRELTVLFSDIANFTTLSERLSSTQLVSLVNTCLQELSECVIAHGGYIDKYIGDAIMAVFGAPELLENHALCACRAALDSQRRLAALNEQLALKYGERLEIRIGINTGEVIVGNVGSEKKKNYTVLGDAVNLAARLESANKEFGTGVLIGPLTAQQTRGLAATRPVALLRVKGKTAAVEAHELIGETAALTDSQRAYLRVCADGFEAWRRRRFEPASEAFAHAVMLRPGDTVSARYHEAALNLAAHPPAPSWTPILELHSK